MRIAVPKERRPQERRVAASPDTAKRLVGMGHEVVVEAGAGIGAAFPDTAYSAVGATIAGSQAEALGSADIVLKVQRPEPQEVSSMRRGAVLVGMLSPLQYPDDVKAYASAGLTAFAMELVPRITRAQAMDVLSSQAAVAGYKAVLIAAEVAPKFFPMLTTAAGTIRPSKVLIVGAGVAGLQAIATARRL
ncbi:MAG TPA: NAD(P)(+) transhydrogenase (Re/Si-specific) subunit alpha, partial [Stellaceae bacterium]|nr:NAD(P)(+) transhydrogenase (Re/Si-specific) subunit alpha [Stellaceae bacterium]